MSQVKSFVITTGSMSPILPIGSLTYTLEKPNYGKGDIITFRDSIGIVTHRVVGAKRVGNAIYYQTKGDANSVIDSEIIAKENIFGTNIVTIPLLGNGIIFFKNPISIFLGAVLPTLLLLFNLKRLFYRFS